MLNDKQILARPGMIMPLIPQKTKVNDQGDKALSYGLGHHGVDLRLSDVEVLVFRLSRLDTVRQWLGAAIEFIGLERLGAAVMPPPVDPKALDRRYLQPLRQYEDATGRYVVISPRTCWLGVAHEKINVPADVLVDCTGKSTYARIGTIVFPTPAEPGWSGYLTLEGLNSLPVRSKLYLMEGVVQLVFHDGKPCAQGYEGKYQDQPKQVTLARV